MWVFCLFNGPTTIKASLVNMELSKIVELVGDWEHYTLHVSNFTGELWSMYFSEHSGGEWVNTCNLEYIERVGVINEPNWLRYIREWGPTIVYDAQSELNKIINYFPILLRYSVETFFELFPTDMYGNEGPIGPKEKDNWVGDER
ncbi:hypothetical protein TEA_017139 [Camellia sinensis var. sinensis]|uniref:Uncharacterized protein n=1 Tax=Camellia sinensis var. sinensis TaxID=542762 RepID=A0A4S4EPL7_CAMSN|nr:hypothetical protein TEA_017139 [Camellia sinensis var. sinensis]